MEACVAADSKNGCLSLHQDIDRMEFKWSIGRCNESEHKKMIHLGKTYTGNGRTPRTKGPWGSRTFFLKWQWLDRLMKKEYGTLGFTGQGNEYKCLNVMLQFYKTKVRPPL